MDFKFEIIAESKLSSARVGRLHTPHGVIDTPNFVPVGTNGVLKNIDNVSVNHLNIALMFCNTYHLLLQPGVDVIKNAGGIHRYINRNAPIITDSGGFQVFSLAYGGVADEIKSKGRKKTNSSVLKITEEGVIFRSYRDGSIVNLTPESSVIAQQKIGADFIVPLDELLPYHTDQMQLKKSLDRTHRWEKRSLDEHLKAAQNQRMYAVVHGGVDPELRRYSAEVLGALPFFGFAIGGSLGKTSDDVVNTVALTTPYLAKSAPKHLLGIGDLPTVLRSVPHGIDTFDSAYPTKAARHGTIFTANGPIKIFITKYKNSFEPIDTDCECFTCKHYSRAFLQHLFKAHEQAAPTLASIHNIAFMLRFMRGLREKILRGEL